MACLDLAVSRLADPNGQVVQKGSVLVARQGAWLRVGGRADLRVVSQRCQAGEREMEACLVEGRRPCAVVGRGACVVVHRQGHQGAYHGGLGTGAYSVACLVDLRDP